MKCWCFFACAITFFVSTVFAATPAQVRQTVEKAKAFLYSRQQDSTWESEFEGHGDQKTGLTALAVYAMLSSGESHQDPRLAPSIAYLKKTDTTGVYALGVRCQVWLALPPTNDVRMAVNKDARVLVSSLKRTGEAKGFYDYNLGSRNLYSHSRAQYGVLGMWAAAQMGVEVSKEYWQLVEKSWTDDQDASGGWAYYNKPRENFPITAGMTAVGVATLFITQDFLHAGDGLSGGGNMRNPAIERGMNWMADNFSKVASDEKYSRAYPYATLYSVERIGVASGVKYFRDIDWYRKGADYLIEQQRRDGSFPSEHGSNVVSTCFAVLFLTRGSAPIVMNKLDYSAGSEAHWNQRNRDVANVSRWIGRQIERDLNWQIVPLNAPIEDWHDAPIVYMSGDQAIELSAEHQAKIKQFIEQGGMALGHADNASTNFSAAFKSLGKKLFPAYDFALLPENHVIYTGQQFPRAKWKRKPSVVSMSNGCRELMVLLPEGDPARAWQLQKPAGKEEQFELAANIFLYATDKRNLRRRGESYLAARDEQIKPQNTIELARLQYDGNWDPEPGGWRRLAAVMNNEKKISLSVEAVKLGAGKLADHTVAHLTGTAAFKFDDAVRAELKSYVEKGGTLIIDAAGGSVDFAAAAEAELSAIVPGAADQLKQPLPQSDPVFSSIKSFGYRTYARSKLGQLTSPRMRGVRVGERLAIYFSREDLSVGLVGQAIDGITGYDPPTATALMSSLIASSVK